MSPPLAGPRTGRLFHEEFYHGERWAGLAGSNASLSCMACLHGCKTIKHEVDASECSKGRCSHAKARCIGPPRLPPLRVSLVSACRKALRISFRSIYQCAATDFWPQSRSVWVTLYFQSSTDIVYYGTPLNCRRGCAAICRLRHRSPNEAAEGTVRDGRLRCVHRSAQQSFGVSPAVEVYPRT